MPRVVDGCVVGGDEGGDGVAQPPPVAAAPAALPVFGAGFLEQHRRLGDHRRRVAGNVPAGVDGVGGFVDEQPVAGGDDAFVAGAARVGDVGACCDVDGVDVDPREVWVVAGGCGCGGAGCDQDGEVGAAGQGWNVAGPGAAPHRPAGIDRAGCCRDFAGLEVLGRVGHRCAPRVVSVVGRGVAG